MLTEKQLLSLNAKINEIMNIDVHLSLEKPSYKGEEKYSSGKMPQKWFSPFIEEWWINCYIHSKEGNRNPNLTGQYCELWISFQLNESVWQDNEGFNLTWYLTKDEKWLEYKEANK